MIMMFAYPTLIQPLFNKMTPLEEGPLKAKIDALAHRIKFPLTKLFVIDGSKRSAHSNGSPSCGRCSAALLTCRHYFFARSLFLRLFQEQAHCAL